MKCPFCGKETAMYGDLIDSDFSADSYSATFDMFCLDCDKTWTREEVYKLANAKNIIE